MRSVRVRVRDDKSEPMKKQSKRSAFPEWALRITALRARLDINQAELARRMECSAMTISRWERGLLQPSAEHFIQLGNLGNKDEAWFFWEMGGIQPAKVVDALGGSRARRSLDIPRAPGRQARTEPISSEGSARMTGVPILKALIGTHGTQGDKRSSLRGAASSMTVGVPASWCPNPAYTSLLRVKGHSMEPLIRNGDLLAVDSFQTDRKDLYGHLVVAASDQTGMCVARLRRYDTLDVLETENRKYEGIVFNRASKGRIVGKVLWWIAGTQNS